MFCGIDSSDLVFAQIKTIGITQQVIGGVLQGCICRSNILFQHLHDSLGADPTLQSFRRIGSLAKIQEPDAGLCFNLLQILPAVGCENEGNSIFVPFPDGIELMLRFDIASVVFALVVNNRWNIGHSFLCLDDPYQLQTHEKSIICIAALSDGRIRRPLCDGKVLSFLRAGAIRVAETIGVGLPAVLAELVVNQQTSFSLRKFHAL